MSWATLDCICSKRLVPVLEETIDSLERFGHLVLSDNVRAEVVAVSAATADRILAPHRKQPGGKAGLGDERQAEDPAGRPERRGECSESPSAMGRGVQVARGNPVPAAAGLPAVSGAGLPRFSAKRRQKAARGTKLQSRRAKPGGPASHRCAAFRGWLPSPVLGPAVSSRLWRGRASQPVSWRQAPAPPSAAPRFSRARPVCSPTLGAPEPPKGWS